MNKQEPICNICGEDVHVFSEIYLMLCSIDDGIHTHHMYHTKCYHGEILRIHGPALISKYLNTIDEETPPWMR